MSQTPQFVTNAMAYLNDIDISSVKQKIANMVDSANQQFTKEELARRKEELVNTMDVLKDTLGATRVKLLQGAAASTSMYQKLAKGEQMENLVAMVSGDKTPEQRQRRLEKIVYLYLLGFGESEFAPSLDIDVMTSDQKAAFFKKLLAPNSRSLSSIKEMVGSLLLLFYNERLGTSAVEMNSEIMGENNEDSITQMYDEILTARRQSEITADVEKKVKTKGFLVAFLSDIIADVPDGIANDAKYYGHDENYINNIYTRLINFINTHNNYTGYIKSGKGLEGEVAMLVNLDEYIDKAGDFIQNKAAQTTAKKVVANLKNSLMSMMTPDANGQGRVFKFKDLKTLLTSADSPDVTTGDPKMVQLAFGSDEASQDSTYAEDDEERGKRKRDSQDSYGDDAPATKQQDVGTGSVSGGRRTRKRRHRRAKNKTAKRGGRRRKSGKTPKRKVTRVRRTKKKAPRKRRVTRSRK